MIRAELERRGDGSFTARASGHAGFAAPGSDIVCAAVTILLRTAAETLERTEGLAVTPLELDEGLLAFKAEAAAHSAALGERLKTAGDFLLNGMESLAREFPQCVEFATVDSA